MSDHLQITLIRGSLESASSGLAAIKAVVDAILMTTDPEIATILAAVDTEVATALANQASIEGKVDTVDTVVDGIQTDLSNATDGLGALKALIDAAQADITTALANQASIEGKVDTVDTVVDGIQTDLDNGTDGLGALKALIDTAQADITTNKARTKVLIGETMVFPSAAAPVTATDKDDGGTTPWASGGWVELVADSGADQIVLENVLISAITGGPDDFEVDIGYGAAASETKVAAIAFNSTGSYIGRSPVIAANQRIAARIRSAQSDGNTADIKAQFRSL